MTHLEARRAEKVRQTERKITLALLCAACIVGFAWMTWLALDAFPDDSRQTVELFAAEGIVMALVGLAVWQMLRRRG